MCDNCVKAGRMTEAEAAQQAEEFAGILGLVSGESGGFQMPPMPEMISQLMVQQMAEEFTSALRSLGYGLSLGSIENGNIVMGIVRVSDDQGTPGYVLGEYAADDVRRLLGE